MERVQLWALDRGREDGHITGRRRRKHEVAPSMGQWGSGVASSASIADLYHHPQFHSGGNVDAPTPRPRRRDPPRQSPPALKLMATAAGLHSGYLRVDGTVGNAALSSRHACSVKAWFIRMMSPSALGRASCQPARRCPELLWRPHIFARPTSSSVIQQSSYSGRMEPSRKQDEAAPAAWGWLSSPTDAQVPECLLRFEL